VPIEYTTSLDGVEPAHLHGFFERWPSPPSPERHLELLAGSYRIVLARQAGSPQVVGFVNAISDGVLYAYIPLLEVLPAHRGRGIGSALMELILEELDDFYAVDLMCDPELQPFYDQFGMHRATGMIIRRR
jgi:ribosomal protein S18 acetylase RimI-like enzyme